MMDTSPSKLRVDSTDDLHHNLHLQPSLPERGQSRRESHGTQRIFLEVGSGNDWHGRDYTKAAVRAVQDAIHHSSLTLLRPSGCDRPA